MVERKAAGASRNSRPRMSRPSGRPRTPSPTIMDKRMLVTVKDGFELNPDEGGETESHQAPYLTLEMHGIRHSTTTKQAAHRVEWNETFSFPDRPSRILEIGLYDKHALNAEPRATATLEIPEARKLDLFVPMSTDRGDHLGRVQVILQAVVEPTLKTQIERERLMRGAPRGQAAGDELVIPMRADGVADDKEDVFRRMTSGRSSYPSSRPSQSAGHSDVVSRDGQKIWVCLVMKDNKLSLDPDGGSGAVLPDEVTRAVYQTWSGQFQTTMRRKEQKKGDSVYQGEINDLKNLYSSSVSSRGALHKKDREVQLMQEQYDQVNAQKNSVEGQLMLAADLLAAKNREIKALEANMTEGQRTLNDTRKAEERNEALLRASEGELRRSRLELLQYRGQKRQTEEKLHKMQESQKAVERQGTARESKLREVEEELVAERSRFERVEREEGDFSLLDEEMNDEMRRELHELRTKNRELQEENSRMERETLSTGAKHNHRATQEMERLEYLPTSQARPSTLSTPPYSDVYSPI